MGFATYCVFFLNTVLSKYLFLAQYLFYKICVFFKQGIQKLASQYLKRDWPGIKADDRNDYR